MHLNGLVISLHTAPGITMTFSGKLIIANSRESKFAKNTEDMF